jgi:redox-sensitive bicupin YhaK (pirin superfamily)
VIAGEYKGTKGPVSDIAGSPNYLDVSLAPLTVFDLSVPEEDTLFIYVIEGDVVIKGASEQWIRAHEIGLTCQGETLTLSSGKDGARFLVVSGTPLKEPIAWHGPIVMNTKEEIQTALEELQNGTFVK